MIDWTKPLETACDQPLPVTLVAIDTRECEAQYYVVRRGSSYYAVDGNGRPLITCWPVVRNVPESSRIDFELPIELCASSLSCSYLGKRTSGIYPHVIAWMPPVLAAADTPIAWLQVDDFGFTPNRAPSIRNVPDAKAVYLNVYASGECYAHATREGADNASCSTRINCYRTFYRTSPAKPAE